MQIYGMLQNAALEVLSADPSGSVQGRVWYNTTSLRPMLDDGSIKAALFRNDQNFIVGTSGTAANNVRLNRAANGVLQWVLGSDVTAEGALSTSLAQISMKHEGYANASKPANGNAGRVIWVTDTLQLAVDSGAAWLLLCDLSSAQTLTNKTLTLPAMDIPLFTDQGSDPAAPAAGKTSLYTKAGHVYKIANGGSATQLAEVGVTNPETVTSKSGTYTALTSDDTIICSGASWSLTLYTAVSNSGRRLKIIHSGTSITQAYTLLTTGGQTIGGVASGNYILSTNGECVTIQSDGTNWQILDSRTITTPSSPVALTFTATSAFVFTCTSANATIGAVYSNNGFLYTVSATIAASVTLTCSGNGSPSASGTLTKVSGVGDATITFSSRTITGQPAAGTTTVNAMTWYRIGNYIYADYYFTQTGAGTAGSGDYLINLPVAADTAYHTIYQITGVNLLATMAATGAILPGYMLNGTNGTNAGAGFGAYLYNSTQFRVGGVIGSGFVWGNGAAPGFLLNGTTVSIAFSVRYKAAAGFQP